MAGAAIRESATFAGRPDQVREARAFVFRLLGPSHPFGDVAVLLASDSLNIQHELEGSNVATGQGDRANTQGQVGLVLTSSTEEEAGEPFRIVCPLSVALRSRSLPTAARRSRHSGQGRDSQPRSLSLLTCRNVQ
jgi:hypothetical protein